MNRLIDRIVHTGWVRRVLHNRLLLFALLLIIQLQFFTINMLNAQFRAPTAGWEPRIPAIDDHITPIGYWLVPYTLGFFLSALVPLWAAWAMPNPYYRQFIFGMLLTALAGYVVYIVYPTYVTKPAPEAVPGTDFFAQTLRRSYTVDAEVSTHNALPSQHVFYAILNACFMIRFRPRARVFWLWSLLAALISASALLTRRHNVLDIVAGYAMAAGGYYAGVWIGARITAALGDAGVPPPASLWRLRWGRRPRIEPAAE